MFLPSHARLAAFRTTRCNWSVWTQAQVVAPIRGVVALAGLPVAEYVLHSLRIGGATFLSVGEASDKYKGYVSPTGWMLRRCRKC